MIRVDCIPGSAEWHRLRLGHPTATGGSKIITTPERVVDPVIHFRADRPITLGRAKRIAGEPLCAKGVYEWEEAVDLVNCPECTSKAGSLTHPDPGVTKARKVRNRGGKLSESRAEYLHQLLAEWALGRPVDEFAGNAWTERGHQFEGEAVEYYRFLREDVIPEPVGLIYRDESRMASCSPDWWADEGGVEVKCPSAAQHVGYLLAGGVPRQYRMQVQFSLWVTGAPWWDFLSYHPDLPTVLERVEPDPLVQAALDEHVPAFIAEIHEGRQKLRERGVRAALEE